MSKRKKIKQGFMVVPYEYFHLPDVNYEDVFILSIANGYLRAGKPFLNYYKTLGEVLELSHEQIQEKVDKLVGLGYLIEGSSCGPVIEYSLSDNLMNV